MKASFCVNYREVLSSGSAFPVGFADTENARHSYHKKSYCPQQSYYTGIKGSLLSGRMNRWPSLLRVVKSLNLTKHILRFYGKLLKSSESFKYKLICNNYKLITIGDEKCKNLNTPQL